jgi:hypothetical protein
MSLRIIENATNIPMEIEILKKRRTESAYEKDQKFISEAESKRNNLIIISELKSRIIFYKNIILFFEDIKKSALDSASIKTRKKIIRERYERIRD